MLFAEAVEQHVVVLPEVSKSWTEIIIDNVEVGDPGVSLKASEVATVDMKDQASEDWKM